MHRTLLRTALVALGLSTLLAASPVVTAPLPARADVFEGDPDGPITGNDAYTTLAGRKLIVEAPGLLDNDRSHPRGGTSLMAVRGGEPAHGTLELLTPDGGFTYTPDPGYQGVDVFYYGAIDNYDLRSRYTPVQITVGDPTVALVPQEKSWQTGGWIDARADGIVDGNPARLQARVRNKTDAVSSTHVQVLDEHDVPVPGGERTAVIEPGATLVYDIDWNTLGRSFYSSYRPREKPYEFTIEVTPSDGTFYSSTIDLSVLPRPIVLVHGYKSNAESSWGVAQRLGFEQLAHPRAHLWAVGDGQVPGTMNTGRSFTQPASELTNTIRENAQEEATYIAGVRERTRAWHVDVVAHSMGGLISRYYIHYLMPSVSDGRPVIQRLVQMGTPNLGSECADLMLNVAWLTGNDPPMMPATLQLSTDYVQDIFNYQVTDLRGVLVTNEVGVVAPMTLCGEPYKGGDGVVAEYSAQWTLPVSDQFVNVQNHLAMTESADDFRRYTMRMLQVRPDGAATPFFSPPTSGRRQAATPGRSPAFEITELTVPAGETVTHELPTPAGDSLGVLLGSADLDVSLVDPAGDVRSTYHHDTGQLFGGVATTEPVAAGRWTLRVTNPSRTDPVTTPMVATIGASPAGFGAVSAQVSRTGRVVVSAAVVDGAAPVRGASLDALVIGETGTLAKVALNDAGRDADALPGDGVYTATTDGLDADPDLQVSLRAALPDGTRRYTTSRVAAADDGNPPATTPPPAPGGIGPSMVAPRILAQSRRLHTVVARRVVATVSAAGTGVGYTWQRRTKHGWRRMAGRTTPNLAVRPRAAGTTRYRVVVANAIGSVTSGVITVKAVRRR